MTVLYYNNLDIRTRNTKLRAVSSLVEAQMPIDRVCGFNKYDIKFEPLPTKEISLNLSFKDCCLKRAMDLWNLDKPISVLWSGGIDSTVAFIALWITAPNKQDLTVRCSTSAINEFPDLFRDMIDSIAIVVSDKDVLNKKYLDDKNIIKVNGDCGDQLFGSIALSNNNEYRYRPWKDIFVQSNKILYPRYNYSDDFFNEKLLPELKELLPQFVEKSPVEITNIFDLYWWINFAVDWMTYDIRIVTIYSQSLEKDTNISFFNAPFFQQWAITNFNNNYYDLVSCGKNVAKKFINDVYKNENYFLNKQKVKSMRNIINTEDKIRNDAILLALVDGHFWVNTDQLPREYI